MNCLLMFMLLVTSLDKLTFPSNTLTTLVPKAVKYEYNIRGHFVCKRDMQSPLHLQTLLKMFYLSDKHLVICLD